MPFAQIDDGVRLYYELTGPEDGPVARYLRDVAAAIMPLVRCCWARAYAGTGDERRRP